MGKAQIGAVQSIFVILTLSVIISLAQKDLWDY